jgi:hypothetical protein
METKEYIRDVLTDDLELAFRIRTTSKPIEEVNKKIFVQVIKLLAEVNDRTEFMSTELGIDVIGYDDKFFQAIEGLMKIAFNKKQVLLIEMYLNEIPIMDKDWDGTITVLIEEEEVRVAFKTPLDLWNTIQKFK